MREFCKECMLFFFLIFKCIICKCFLKGLVFRNCLMYNNFIFYVGCNKVFIIGLFIVKIISIVFRIGLRIVK